MDILIKTLYLIMQKWTGRRQDWSLIHANRRSVLRGIYPSLPGPDIKGKMSGFAVPNSDILPSRRQPDKPDAARS